MFSVILLTLYAGFIHAFESDHLLAVSSMVTNRNKIQLAIKDGMFWGLGHTSTIVTIGFIFLLLKFHIDQHLFSYFEALVGFMLVILGITRIKKWFVTRADKKNREPHLHSHDHTHTPTETTHLPAYSIGLIHGLAGSGALMLVVMSQSNSTSYGLLYLVVFGLGSVCGMMLATSVFSMPFSKNIFQRQLIQTILIFTSAILCILYGYTILIDNIPVIPFY
jgi:cytochrome c biogenesis protein CcdA